MKAVMRSYCVFVLLDRPKKTSFVSLLRLRLRGKLVWFAPHIPLWAKLLGVLTKPLPNTDELLLWELERLPDDWENQVLTLVPLTDRTRAFLQNRRKTLEISYRFERENL